MRVIFCAHPLDQRAVDPDYAAEASAATAHGLSYDLIDFEALVNDGDAERSVRRVRESPTSERAVYRGWMLRPAQYASLYEALAARGVRLINDPGAYRHCHYLPESYAVIQEHTPVTAWMTVDGELRMDEVIQALAPFGAGPVIVKDFVKSRKHEWAEACFIPSAADREAVERVVRRFIALQGDDLNEGLVFREFVELEPLATHPRSGMPLTVEYRLFFAGGELLAAAPYWDEGAYTGPPPPIDWFERVARSVRSAFFTMDVARRRDGEWLIVELGDGQVAGLPASLDPGAFYAGLKARLGSA